MGIRLQSCLRTGKLFPAGLLFVFTPLSWDKGTTQTSTFQFLCPTMGLQWIEYKEDSSVVGGLTQPPVIEIGLPVQGSCKDNKCGKKNSYSYNYPNMTCKIEVLFSVPPDTMLQGIGKSIIQHEMGHMQYASEQITKFRNAINARVSRSCCTASEHSSGSREALITMIGRALAEYRSYKSGELDAIDYAQSTDPTLNAQAPAEQETANRMLKLYERDKKEVLRLTTLWSNCK